MSKYPGRILKATAPTVSTVAAKGIWTVDEALQYKQAGTWPEQPVIDPYFNQTTLLLHGDGTNGAQNNTFLDSSTNNFGITPNGNTTQGTFSPFSGPNGYWSVYFDGSDYLSKPDLNISGEIQFGTGDFTIETWVNFTKTDAEGGSGRRIFGFDTGTPFEIYIGATGTILVWNRSTTYITSSALANTGQFVHIALTRSGTDLKLFINGTQSGSTATVSTNFAPISLVIGANPGNVGTGRYEGYMSNFRILTGTALYTGTFTPSTTPLTGITNTSLLICQSNRFIENSGNNSFFSVSGNPSVQPFSPFAPSAAYSASVNGGSGYFDGTGDRLSAPNSSAFSLTTEDFTFDFWFYATSTTSFQRLFEYNNGTTSNTQYQYSVYLNAGNVTFQNISGSTGLSVAKAYVPFCWNYVNITRSSTSATVTVNGSSTTGTVYGTANNPAGATLNIGARSDGNSPFSGYLSDLRIIKNSATSYSIPTAPLTAVSGTSILLNFQNAGIFDNTGKNVLETVGNAQIDTTTVKYGTGSMEFDGTGDYLLLPNSQNIVFGSGDFTIEMWVYSTATGTAQNFVDTRNGSSAGWVINKSTDNEITFYSEVAAATVVNAALTANQWVHAAVVRSSGTITLYLDGTSADSGANTSSYTSQQCVIGARYSKDQQYYTGFIDDLRITKGVARYTTTFTPPAKAFTDQ